MVYTCSRKEGTVILFMYTGVEVLRLIEGVLIQMFNWPKLVGVYIVKELVQINSRGSNIWNSQLHNL